MKNDKKVRIGVFGLTHGKCMVENLANYPDAELVALCDKNEQAIADSKMMLYSLSTDKENLAPIACFTNFNDFIQFDMDAVILCNYATEHAPFAIKALKHGKHVLSALLPVQTMAQAVSLVETVEKTGLVYAFDENYCYRPDTFEMWRRYQNGDIGEVQFAEGEYIHDSMNMWPMMTGGDRNHWRNRMYATYYCTHSLGPLVTITGLRPKQVVGFEARPNIKEQEKLGLRRGAGALTVTMENGAIFRTVDGPLKREPGSVTWHVYGDKGMMMTATGLTVPVMQPFNIYVENENMCQGKWEDSFPHVGYMQELAETKQGPGGSNFYSFHFFVQKILGREEGKKYSIDVYQTMDMSLPGILGYYSVLDGNKPYEVPDFRDPAQREPWRNDNRCTDPKIASEDQLLPCSSFGDHDDIPEDVYDNLKRLCRDNGGVITKIEQL